MPNQDIIVALQGENASMQGKIDQNNRVIDIIQNGYQSDNQELLGLRAQVASVDIQPTPEPLTIDPPLIDTASSTPQ